MIDNVPYNPTAMNQQSDFGRLFRKQSYGVQDPIENYTSEALAIAIEHDDGPMQVALERIHWPRTRPFEPDNVLRIRPKTQHFLPAADVVDDGTIRTVRQGYLDLVLVLELAHGTSATAWVEVKIDTGEHGGQLDVYADHAHRDPSRPCIFTLSKYEVRSVDHHPKHVQIGWLSWKDLVAAIEQMPGADRRWADLLSFLEEEGIAWRALPIDKVDTAVHLKVLTDVNRLLKDRWPHSEMNFSGTAPLRKHVFNKFKDSGRLVATGGPLTYGLVPRNGEWFWSISVGVENFQRVPLDGAAIVHRADEAGLSPQWQRSRLTNAAVAKEVPLCDCASREDAEAWFAAALDELRATGILRPFIEGLAEKRKKVSSSPR